MTSRPVKSIRDLYLYNLRFVTRFAYHNRWRNHQVDSKTALLDLTIEVIPLLLLHLQRIFPHHDTALSLRHNRNALSSVLRRQLGRPS